MRLAPVALAVALLSGPAAAWNQMGGDAGQSGVVDLPPVDLDVVAFYPLAPEGFGPQGGPGLLPTPAGLVGLGDGSEEGGTCRWIVVRDPFAGGFEAGPEEPCPYDGLVAAYDASLDLVFVCMDGKFDDPLLQARTTTGAVVWTASPDLPLGDPVATEQSDWFCNNVSLDEAGDRIYAPWSTNLGANRITALDAQTGERIWSRTVTAAVFGNVHTDPSYGTGFALSFSTLTLTGLVVGGEIAPVAGGTDRSDRGFVWLDLEGNIVGRAAAQTRLGQDGGLTDVRPDLRPVSRGSIGATASGPYAAFALGERVLVVNPGTDDPALVAPLVTNEATTGAGEWGSPRWWERHLLVPLTSSVLAYDSRDLSETWTWIESNEWRVQDVIIVPPRDAYVSAEREDGAVVVFRVDLATGETVQRIPLPIQRRAWLLALSGGEGLLAWDPDGIAAVLARAPDALRPSAALSDAYPAVGERVEVTPSGSASSFLVSWEPGFLAEVVPGETASHEYATAGVQEVRVMAVHADGRTATRTLAVHVGGTPPEDLTAIQQAFSRDNQDVTFFVLGLAATGAGAAFGLWRVESKRRRLQRELAAIERAHAATKDRPSDCEAALAERKAHARGLLLDGKLNEAQFSVVERRVDELAATLRLDALDTGFDFLPVGMARTLREMLADGRISTWEHRHFTEALERDDILTAEQKTKVRALIDAWFARDVGGPRERT